MPSFTEHCAKSLELFKEDGNEYHIWLDQYAQFGFHHRQVLHNKEGIEIGVQLFGEIARRHLVQHIKDDWPDDEKIPTIRQLREEGRTSYPVGMKVKLRKDE